MAIDEEKLLNIKVEQCANRVPVPCPGLSVAERVRLSLMHATNVALELFAAAEQWKEETGKENSTIQMAIHVGMAMEDVLRMMLKREEGDVEQCD